MDSKNPIKIIIVDDSKLTVLGLKTSFKNSEDIEVIETAENGKIAVEMIKNLNPDVVLMDIGMPVMDGIQAVKEIKKLNISTKILMLTSHDREQDVFDALSAGANSYCMKDIEPECLINAIKSTYNGVSWLDPAIAEIVLNNLGKNNQKEDIENPLTEREIEILGLIAKGLNNSDISKALYISINTVKTHIKNIFQKLEVEDRTQAAMKALEKDII